MSIGKDSFIFSVALVDAEAFPTVSDVSNPTERVTQTEFVDKILDEMLPKLIKDLVERNFLEKSTFLGSSFPSKYLSYKLQERSVQPSNGNFLRFEFSEDIEEFEVVALFSRVSGQENRVPVMVKWAKKYVEQEVPFETYARVVGQVLSIHFTNNRPDSLKEKDAPFRDLLEHGFPDWSNLSIPSLYEQIEKHFKDSDSSKRILNFIIGYCDQIRSICRLKVKDFKNILRLNRFLVLRAASDQLPMPDRAEKLDNSKKYLAAFLDSISSTSGRLAEEIFLPNGFNRLIFGAPGTSKSFDLNREFPDAIRTVFHSEYSNSDFVGTFRPISSETSAVGIKYDFVAGPFAKAVAAALANPKKLVVLIIEEINRGHAAAIFGEILHLLDRKPNGESAYFIRIDDAFYQYLVRKTGKSDCVIQDQFRIPYNLAIIGTMNSADQSVGVFDSAFKRRWHPEYKSIDFNDDLSVSKKTIPYAKRKVPWRVLVEEINSILMEQGIVEDRCIGPFLLEEGEHEDDKAVADKFLYYLFEDVLRFESDRSILFSSYPTDKHLSFRLLRDRYLRGEKIFCERINKKLSVLSAVPDQDQNQESNQPQSQESNNGSQGNQAA